MNDLDIIDITPQGNMASGSMVRELVTAEIDQQISTAHAYPRSITKVNRNIMSLVTLDQAFAEQCTYALPRGGKPITGPSIRMAEVVFSQWGNCRGGARVVHVDRKEMFIEAEGVFHDLETNSATTKRVRRRISTSQGKLLSDDMIIVTGNAACSIAFRNAVLSGVPQMIWEPAYKTALKMIKGDVVTLPERRTNMMKNMAAFGLKPEQVFALIGVDGMADVGIDELFVLGGYHNALVNEETTVEALISNSASPSQSTNRVAGSISQRAAAAGPATAQEKTKPQSNKEADDALAAEAKRVADKRAADEAKAAALAEAKKADAEAKALRDADLKAQKDAKAKAQEAEDEARMAAEAKAEAEARAEAMAKEMMESHQDDPDLEDVSDIATDAASLVRYFDNILADLIDGNDVEKVKAEHAKEIAAIKANNSDLYASLQEEMNAA